MCRQSKNISNLMIKIPEMTGNYSKIVSFFTFIRDFYLVIIIMKEWISKGVKIEVHISKKEGWWKKNNSNLLPYFYRGAAFFFFIWNDKHKVLITKTELKLYYYWPRMSIIPTRKINRFHENYLETLRIVKNFREINLELLKWTTVWRKNKWFLQ